MKYKDSYTEYQWKQKALHDLANKATELGFKVFVSTSDSFHWCYVCNDKGIVNIQISELLGAYSASAKYKTTSKGRVTGGGWGSSDFLPDEITKTKLDRLISCYSRAPGWATCGAAVTFFSGYDDFAKHAENDRFLSKALELWELCND